jgi:adenylosuccinate lyase
VFDVARIDEIEREVKHDVIAFLSHLAEIVGPEARFVHQGMTSSDVLDTCLSVQLTRAADLLLADLDALLAALKRRAFEHKLTVCIGRSHGVHAEPTTFGLKLAQAYAEFDRARERLVRPRRHRHLRHFRRRRHLRPCRPAGRSACRQGPRPRAVEPVSSQVIPRDRHALFFATLAVVASSIERLAVEIRHLQRTEVLEAEEPFGEAQKGSSAMPHKRNPVLTENLTGLARLVRSAVMPALENVALWHERDISHSAVERAIGPDTTVHLDFALARLTTVIDGLVVYPDAMQRNLDRLGGLIHSQRVLLALTQKGASREDAYAWCSATPCRCGAAKASSSTCSRPTPTSPPCSRRGTRGPVRPRLSPQARRHDLRPGVRGGLTLPCLSVTPGAGGVPCGGANCTGLWDASLRWHDDVGLQLR